MAKQTPIRIGISVGDTSGIGMEVILKALSEQVIYSDCCPIIYASEQLLLETQQGLSSKKVDYSLFSESKSQLAGRVYLKEVRDEGAKDIPGKPSILSGLRSFLSLEKVTADLLAGQLDAMVTAPIDKKNIQQEGFDFPGHTEYLAARSGSEEVLMLLVSGALRVGVITGHIPLHKVAKHISQELILQKARMVNASLKKDFGIASPRIAILGLNPHAGDGGLLGSEEESIIAPAIATARAEGILAEGPFPADGFFGSSSMRTRFDAVLAMYHDQGLAPFKALAFGGGVNFTAGLPIVRTSPDHGTAFDIAGQDKADGSSFREAFKMAVEVVQKRAAYTG